jgi:hypothetical protein
MKHTYIISINRIPATREPIEYKFRQTRCTLTCAKDAAAVHFEMSTKKSHEDLISFRVDLAKDAMRKMYLLHAMRFDSRLRVRSVTVTIDGESRVYEQGCPGFPFLYSMLTAKTLGLPESWHDRDFLTTVLTSTKSKTDNDHRYACLFSFLAGTGKVYESERFTCYWTAVNALYNYIFDCMKPHYAASQGAARFEDLSKTKQKAMSTGDNFGIGHLMKLTGSGLKLDSQDVRRANKRRYGAVKSHLRSMSREEFAELYRQLLAHRSDPDWFPAGPLGEHLREFLPGTGTTCWGFLVLDYAYYIRCHYLHGEKTPILFTAASDPELAAFRSLNVFLGEFLKEIIPEIFRDDWFTEETYRSICPPRK